MNTYRLNILFIGLCMLSFFAACSDDFKYNVGSEDVPEGFTDVSLTFGYSDFTPALHTRTAGDAIETMKSLWMVMYNTDGSLFMAKEITQYVKPNDSGESWAGVKNVSLNTVLPNGNYRIYAVANVNLQTYLEQAEKSEAGYLTEKDLRRLEFNWNSKDVTKNNQMFGLFTNAENAMTSEGKMKWDAETVPVVTVSQKHTKLHAYLYRLASKVTVAYDGSGLYPGVSIYLMGVTIKDIPNHCALGNYNKIGQRPDYLEEGEKWTQPKKEDELISEGETISYCEGIDLSDGLFSKLSATKLDNSADNKYYPRPNGSTDREDWKNSVHTNIADALFFYENLQGEGKPKSTESKEENDGVYVKPDKEYGTYIEVEALFRIENTITIDGNTTIEPQSGVIKYRFMLGKDKEMDYDAERNYHYKLTLNFKGTPWDKEWHMDYKPTVLEVTDPVVMDYRGKVFDPDTDYPNLGHEFVDGTSIRVTSYEEGSEDKLQPFTVTFDGQEEAPAWLTWEKSDGRFPYEKNLVFKVNPQVIQSESKVVNQTTFNPARGTESNPVNLADKNRETVSPASAIAYDTANCYVIDAPGWYLLPAVYGNARKNNSDNESAYKPGGTGLSVFKNHLGREISSPYIKDEIQKAIGAGDSNAKLPVAAALIWQDVDNLVDYNFNTILNDNPIKYLDNAYGGKGGILFQVKNIQEGNSVIGLFDQNTQVSNNDWSHNWDNPVIMQESEVIWSWHIWVTNMMSTNILAADRTLTITSDKSGDFKVLPFNLGWCSNTGDPAVKYYPARECTVKITSGDKSIEKKISQLSHISIPCGNNPYFQWGRKDPFHGAIASWNGKDIYMSMGLNQWASSKRLPLPLSGDYGNNDMTQDAKNEGRKTTIDAIDSGDLVKYPYKWHNPKCIAFFFGGSPWSSVNRLHKNLWGDNGTDKNVKTVYDPCPVGYKVPNSNVFTGFTVNGDNPTFTMGVDDPLERYRWFYDVIVENIVDNYKNTYEFYTNKNKNQSIIFPKSGYRDWDAEATPYKYGSEDSYSTGEGVGYVWTARQDGYHTPDGAPDQFDWVNYLDFSHKEFLPGIGDQYYVRPQNKFYGCDGFPIRPVVDD